MRQLMCQNKLKLRLTGRQIVRQQYRRAENAERQRGAAAFGHTDPRVAQKAEPIKQRVDGRLRQNAPGVYGSDPLWLEREPTVEEVEASLSKWDLNSMDEVVFCGYGEPAERLKDLLEVAAWIKKNYTVKTRINTNGLADLIWGEPTAPWLEGKIDAVSISLNAIDAEEYLRLTRSKFGIGSYDAMLKYTHECTKYVPTVMMTVVDQVTTPEEQESARKICEKLGATLRVRPFES